MALYGHLNITMSGGDETIGFWTARRTTRLESTAQVSVYECTMLMSNEKPVAFEVEHRYEDGAVTLLQKLLAKYQETIST